MTKLLTTALLAMLIALGVYMARRRIVFALKTGAIAYIVLLFGRLLLSLGSFADKLDELIWPACLLFLVWVCLWWVSTQYAARRDREKAAERLRRVRRGSRVGRVIR